jgi:hypothetical protein
VTPEHIEIVSQRYGSAPLADVFGYEPGWPVLSASRHGALERLLAQAEPTV